MRTERQTGKRCEKDCHCQSSFPLYSLHLLQIYLGNFFGLNVCPGCVQTMIGHYFKAGPRWTQPTKQCWMVSSTTRSGHRPSRQSRTHCPVWKVKRNRWRKRRVDLKFKIQMYVYEMQCIQLMFLKQHGYMPSIASP